MRRLALLLFCFVTSLAQAAPNSILQRPYDLDTGHGVLRGTMLLPRRAIPLRQWSCWSPAPAPPTATATTPRADRTPTCCKLAEALAESGIASVRYDKRGVARSLPAAPREEELSVGAYVDDVVAWSDRLARDPRFGRLILVGHSEGALIASLAAPQTHAEALVSLAGSGHPIDDVLREQLRGRLPPPLLAQADQLIDGLQAGQLQPRRYPAGAPQGAVPPQRAALPDLAVPPGPGPRLRPSAQLPTLIVQGPNDIQVGVADAQALQRAKPDTRLPSDHRRHEPHPADRPEQRSPAACLLQRPQPAAGPRTGRAHHDFHPARAEPARQYACRKCARIWSERLKKSAGASINHGRALATPARPRGRPHDRSRTDSRRRRRERRRPPASLGGPGPGALSPAAPGATAHRPHHRRPAPALRAAGSGGTAQRRAEPAAPEHPGARPGAAQGREPAGGLGGSPQQGSALRRRRRASPPNP